jgi:transposase
MQTIKTIGLDIAKSVFQVHGIHAAGSVTVRRQLKRRYALAFFEKLAPCLIGIEACASAHHWSRQLQALGHQIRRGLDRSRRLVRPRTRGPLACRRAARACGVSEGVP